PAGSRGRWPCCTSPLLPSPLTPFGHRQALQIPLSALAAQMDDIKKRIQQGKDQAPVILMCQSGWRGSKAGRQLRKAGVEAVFNLEGGFDAWQQAGLPVTKRS
ncbi:MAG: rhodanese-like domain-containing protein, partial [Burkholderiaceae bacterium]